MGSACKSRLMMKVTIDQGLGCFAVGYSAMDVLRWSLIVGFLRKITGLCPNLSDIIKGHPQRKRVMRHKSDHIFQHQNDMVLASALTLREYLSSLATRAFTSSTAASVTRVQRDQNNLMHTCWFCGLELPAVRFLEDDIIETPSGGLRIVSRNEILELRVAKKERVYTARWHYAKRQWWYSKITFREYHIKRLPNHARRCYKILKVMLIKSYQVNDI